jgi:pyridoxine kinase
VALPILSSAGIETAAMPTAILSAHTAIDGYTYRDLTDDMPLFLNHWKSLDLNFDAIYSGFLGSARQTQIVLNFIDEFKRDGTLVLVDPAMADHGSMYPTFDLSYVDKMKKLCQKADLIVPNMTEAFFMLGLEYKEGPFSKDYIEKILKDLSKLGPSQVVLTGVFFNADELGAACYDRKTGKTEFYFSPFVDRYYHGTGDVFASVLLCCLLNGCDLNRSVKISVDFIYKCLLRSSNEQSDPCWGINFEAGLPELSKELGLIEV